MSTTKKNYIYEDREYGDVARRRSKVDVQGREVPLSEIDQPYLKNNDEDDTYQSYEEEYPDWDWPEFPDLPDPIPGPCQAEDGCGHVKIQRDHGATLECDKEYWFRNTSEVHGCEEPGGGAGIVGWQVTVGGKPGGTILSMAVGLRWQAPDCCQNEEVVVRAFDAFGCEDIVVFTLECGLCCDAFTLTGADTADHLNAWVGTISPACPDATYEVKSAPGGCYVGNVYFAPDGSFIQVIPQQSSCGAFDVEVTGPTFAEGENCTPVSAKKTVKINDDSHWYRCQTSSSSHWPFTCLPCNPTPGCKDIYTPTQRWDFGSGMQFPYAYSDRWRCVHNAGNNPICLGGAIATNASCTFYQGSEPLYILCQSSVSGVCPGCFNATQIFIELWRCEPPHTPC